MSTVTTTIVPCPNLQDAIVAYFKSCHTTTPPTTLLNFLLSPENTSGIRQLVNPQRGKKRTVELIYDQALPTSEATAVSSCDLSCTASTERGNLSETYDIDCTDGYEIEEKITLTDWMDSCRDNGELIYSRIVALMNALNSKINAKTVDELNPVIGDWDSSVSAIGTINADGFLQLPTLVTGTTNPAPYSFQNIDLAKQLTQFCASTFMISGIDWYRYMRLLQSGCCTDAGLDIRELFARFGQVVAFDKDFNSTFGADTAVLMQLRSAQLLTLNYAMNADVPALQNINWSAASNYYSTTVFHPESGLPIDLVLKNDCGAIHIIMRATTKLVALPNNLYASGESMEGVNWIAGIKSVNS
jgi:hypothetical protein